jgi:hypothetical protein
MAKPTISNRLEVARAELAATNRQIAEIEAERNKALLADDDRTAVKLAGQADELRRLAHGHEDKIKLLEVEAEREANERRVREKEGLILRIEKKLAERDAAAAELQAAIEAADRAFRKMITLARDCRAAWPWAPSDLPPLLLGEAAIVAAVKHDLFRAGARPLLGGGQDKPGAGLSFPGGQAPRLELVGMPDRVTPLADVAREATALARKIMRSGKSTGGATVVAGFVDGVPPALMKEPPPLSPQQQQLAQLLAEQERLANDFTPAGEAAYDAVVKKISALQAEGAAA